MKLHRKNGRVLSMIAVAAAGAFAHRAAVGQTTPVTLLTSNAANWSTAGIWSDGSNPASNTLPTTNDAYQVSSGQILNAPSLTATGNDYFYGASLSLNHATLNFPGSSGGTITRNDSFGGQVIITDSSLVFTSTNATTHNISGGLVFSDTGSSSNTLTMVSSNYTQNLTLTGAVSGSGIINFNLSGGASGRNVNVNSAANNYSGAIVMGSTPGATTFNLNRTLGNVSSYTIGTSWTLADALSNNINGSNMSITGTLKIAGTAETLGNVNGAGTISATSTSPVSLTLAGTGTGNFSGSLTDTAGTLSLAMNGSGTQILSGAVNYTGITTVSSGTLQFGTESSLYNNNQSYWTASNIIVNSGATAAFSVGGTSQFTATDLGTLLALGTASGGFLSGSSVGLDTTNASGGIFAYASPIANPNSGSNTMGLTKLGTGSLDLQVPSTYTGPTLVSKGTLIVDAGNGNTGALGVTAVTVAGGATLLAEGNTSIGGSLSLAGGATSATQGLLDMRDGTMNTLAIGAGLTLGSGSNGAVIDLDFGPASGSNDALNVTGAVSTSGLTTINLNVLSTLAYGSYTLITDTAGGLSNGSGFALGSRPGGYSYSLASSTADALILTVGNGNATPATAYWTGKASAAGGDTSNNWGFGSSSTNWSTTLNGATDPLAEPGSITNVIFTAANVSTAALSTKLDNAYSILSLAFDTSSAPAVTSVSINTSTNTLTLGAGGLTVGTNDTSSATILGAGTGIVLGSNQIWANNSSSQSLTVNTAMAGNASTGTQTLTLAGNGSGAMIFNGVIADGTAGGNLALILSQTGVVQLNAANTFTGGVTINSGTLRLGNTAAISNASLGLITFNPTGAGDLQLNGNSITVPVLNTVAGQIIENAGSSPATLNINASSGSNTFGGLLRDGTGGGALSLTVSGASTLTLAVSNTYSGTTTLGAGSTINATVAGAIPTTSSLAFTGASTLNMSGFALAVSGLTVAGSTSFTPALSNTTSLTVNTTSNAVIGGTTGGVTDTLDLSALSTFNFNASSSVVLIIAGSNAAGGNGTLNLAAASTIKAGTLDVGVAPTSLSAADTSTGILALGTTNVINVNTIVVGDRPSGVSTGTISFEAGLTNPTVTIAGFAGGASTANMIVGESASSDYSSSTGTADFSGGTVNASFGTLSIGLHTYNNLNFTENAIGTFTMGTGTVTASNIILGQTVPGGTNTGRTSSLASGTFNLGTASAAGGTLQVNTLTMGDQQKESTNTSAVTSIFNFDSGLLEAAVIQPGATQNTSAGTLTRTFNWYGGTIQNYNATTGLSISIPTINLAGTGTFDITTGQTGIVSSNISGGGSIVKTDLGTLTLSGSNTYTGGTNVTAGKLNLAASTAFPALTPLTISPGATAAVTRFNSSQPVTVAQISSLTNGGLLDVGSNAVILQNPPTGTIATVMSQLQSGYNNGNWNGTAGITSTAAAADTTHLTAVGVMMNDTGANTVGSTGSAIYTSLDGAPTSDGDILVKYTYYGDADLSGVVDGTDYSLIDNGVLNHLTGWYNGDFNYDGVINGSDYTLIDNSYNTQGASLASEVATATAQIAPGSAAVPEPASLGMLGIAVIGLLSRRSRGRKI